MSEVRQIPALVDLGTLGGDSSSATAVNNSGTVVGCSSITEGYNHAFVWTRAEGMTDIGTPSGRPSCADLISDTGMVVGSYRWDNDPAGQFVWTKADGVIDLDGQGSTHVAALNNAGQVVGDTAMLDGTRAFLWTRADGMLDLGTLEGFDHSYATDVNESGDVVGFCESSGYPTRAFLWTRTEGMIDLGTLGRGCTATAITAGGDVYGSCAVGDLRLDHAFRWTRSEGMTDLGAIPNAGDLFYSVVAASDSGYVIGEAIRTGEAHRVSAYVWTNAAGMVELVTPPGGRQPIPEAVNNQGVVVGMYVDGSQQVSAFAWTKADGMIDIGTLGGRTSWARAVSNSGWVVGESATGGESSATHAFIWRKQGL